MQRMFCLGIATLVTVLATLNRGHAQDTDEPVAATAGQVASQLSGADMTPEIWLYLQETRRHSDPKEAVRRKAELRTAQRQARLESQKWFGFSGLRPQANPVPFTGTYSPVWGGNGRNGYVWTGVGSPYMTSYAYSRSR